MQVCVCICVARCQTLCLCVLSILYCAHSRFKLSSPRHFPQLKSPKIDLTVEKRVDERREEGEERPMNESGGKAQKMS